MSFELKWWSKALFRSFPNTLLGRLTAINGLLPEGRSLAVPRNKCYAGSLPSLGEASQSPHHQETGLYKAAIIPSVRFKLGAEWVSFLGMLLWKFPVSSGSRSSRNNNISHRVFLLQYKNVWKGSWSNNSCNGCANEHWVPLTVRF